MNVLPPFVQVSEDVLGNVLSASSSAGSVIAATHDHQLRFISNVMGRPLDRDAGFLEGVMFELEELRSVQSRLEWSLPE